MPECLKNFSRFAVKWLNLFNIVISLTRKISFFIKNQQSNCYALYTNLLYHEFKDGFYVKCLNCKSRVRNRRLDFAGEQSLKRYQLVLFSLSFEQNIVMRKLSIIIAGLLFNALIFINFNCNSYLIEYRLCLILSLRKNLLTTLKLYISFIFIAFLCIALYNQIKWNGG